MKKSLLLLSIFVVVKAHAQSNWDLQQCIDYAQKHSIQLKQAALQTQINKNNTLQSKAALLPNLNGGVAHTYNFGQTIDRFTNEFADSRVLSQNFFLSSNVTLFGGLAQVNTIKANEYNYKSSVESLKQQENDLSLNVATAFINVVFCDELLKIAKNQFDITKEQLDRTQKLVSAGSLAKSVEYDLKAQLANEEVNVTSADNNYQLAILNLKQLINADSLNTFSISKPQVDVTDNNFLSISINSIYETALKNQHSIISTEYGLLSAEKRLAAARGMVSPNLSLNGSIGTGTSELAKDILGSRITGFNPSGFTNRGDTVFTPRVEFDTRRTTFADQFKNNANRSIGFQLNIPIFNGLQTYTSVKNAKIQVLNAKYTQDIAKQNLYRTIAQAYANAKAALNRYNANKTSLEASEQSFSFAQQKFNVGAINTFEFNQAKTRLSSAQSNLIQAKYDYVFRLKVLDFYQGKSLTL
jgi:outer membrane protein